MKTIIAGSRGIADPSILAKAIEQCPWVITSVVSGHANGVDMLGEIWARDNDIPLEKYLAKWERYGRSAGYKRNKEMADNAEALLAVWDSESKGTKHMIDIAKKQGLKIHIFTTKEAK